MKQNVEKHPLGFFLPKNAKVLMLGSFPPKQERWSMNFYYPNFQNDMWRIMGLIFFGDKDYFTMNSKKFDAEKTRSFCLRKAIALGDSAQEIVRLKDNASDNFLKVIKPIDFKKVVAKIPKCKAVILTGQKAADVFLESIDMQDIKIGCSERFVCAKRTFNIYRAPSSSRAYPKPLPQKALDYKRIFQEIGLIKKDDKES
jgi:G:T/U-mismatch repair DNA glycosylase